MKRKSPLLCFYQLIVYYIRRTNAICTVKVRNRTKSEILDVIKPFVTEILDVWEV